MVEIDKKQQADREKEEEEKNQPSIFGLRKKKQSVEDGRHYEDRGR